MFFKEWKTAINDAVDIPQQGTLPTIPKAAVQFAKHEDFLRRAPILIARRSRYLTAEQVQELSNHLEGHQGADIGILPAGKVLAQVQYDRFFNTAQGLDWLDF